MPKLPLLLLALLSCAPLCADTLIFNSGEELDATILERDEVQLKVEVDYGTLLIPLERIKRIDVDTPEQAEGRAKKRAAAKEEAERMKAEGKVLYKGEWVDADEKKAAEDKLADERKKKKDAELAAKKKADDLAAKKKADDLAAQKKIQSQQLANNNNNSNNNNRRSRNDRYNSNNNTMNNGSSQNYNNNVNSAFQSYGNGVNGYSGNNGSSSYGR